MGFALLALDADPPRLLQCGVVDVPRDLSNADRLVRIADALDALIADHAPRALALERLYFNKNVRTAMSVAEARGIALVCGARAGLEIAEYTPQQVKQSVTGNGGSEKKAVQLMVRHILKLDAAISEDNVADAVAVALTHAHQMRWNSTVNRATSGSPARSESVSPERVSSAKPRD
jgi:crossover junction endodeoxyribonuclease RuvC